MTNAAPPGPDSASAVGEEFAAPLSPVVAEPLALDVESPVVAFEVTLEVPVALPDDPEEPPAPVVTLTLPVLDDVALPVLPPVFVAVDKALPVLPVVAAPVAEPTADPEEPPVAVPVTLPELPEPTVAAMLPLPEVEPDPAVAEPEPAEVPVVDAAPPLPLVAVVPPLLVASPEPPLVADPPVVVVEVPDEDVLDDDDVPVDEPELAAPGVGEADATVDGSVGGGLSVPLVATVAARARALMSTMGTCLVRRGGRPSPACGLRASVRASRSLWVGDVLRLALWPSAAPFAAQHLDDHPRGGRY